MVDDAVTPPILGGTGLAPPRQAREQTLEGPDIAPQVQPAQPDTFC